jgi:hypothetical protein
MTTTGSDHGPAGRRAQAIQVLSWLVGRPVPCSAAGVEPSPSPLQSTGEPWAGQAGRQAPGLGATARGSQPVQNITHSPPSPLVTAGSCAKCGWMIESLVPPPPPEVGPKDTAPTWEKQVLSARGVQARRKALRIRHINGMEVRKKMPRGFK